ncbi:MAG: hypothetical protein QXL34_05310 [Thermosphaera sp.]
MVRIEPAPLDHLSTTPNSLRKRVKLLFVLTSPSQSPVSFHQSWAGSVRSGTPSGLTPRPRRGHYTRFSSNMPLGVLTDDANRNTREKPISRQSPLLFQLALRRIITDGENIVNDMESA